MYSCLSCITAVNVPLLCLQHRYDCTTSVFVPTPRLHHFCRCTIVVVVPLPTRWDFIFFLLFCFRMYFLSFFPCSCQIFVNFFPFPVTSLLLVADFLFLRISLRVVTFRFPSILVASLLRCSFASCRPNQYQSYLGNIVILCSVHVPNGPIIPLSQLVISMVL